MCQSHGHTPVCPHHVLPDQERHHHDRRHHVAEHTERLTLAKWKVEESRRSTCGLARRENSNRDLLLFFGVYPLQMTTTSSSTLKVGETQHEEEESMC